MNYEKGARVIALLDAKGGVVRSFGPGTYVGDEVPPADVHAMFHDYSFPNPRIDLDSGETVWGFQCWWGPEQQIKERFPDPWVWETVSVDRLKD